MLFMVGRLEKRIKNYVSRHEQMRKDNSPYPSYEPDPYAEEYSEYADENQYPVGDDYDAEPGGYDELPQHHYTKEGLPELETDLSNVPTIPSFEEGPLSILDEIKHLPTPKGAYPTVIYGTPVDLHILEDYITRISPFNIRTAMRYHNARTIEELRGYTKFGQLKMKKMNFIMLLLLVGMAILGIVLIFFMPQIMEMLQGMA